VAILSFLASIPLYTLFRCLDGGDAVPGERSLDSGAQRQLPPGRGRFFDALILLTGS